MRGHQLSRSRERTRPSKAGERGAGWPEQPRLAPLLPPTTRIVAVAAGGALGAGARHLVTSRYPTAPPGGFPGGFPWGTFAVNVSGAFLLGVALTLFTERFPHWRHRQSFLCTGVLGAYTTFSTVSLELVSQTGAGVAGLAVGYALVSLVAGLGAALLGVAVARPRR